jgi:hypothetical protein
MTTYLPNRPSFVKYIIGDNFLAQRFYFSKRYFPNTHNSVLIVKLSASVISTA